MKRYQIVIIGAGPAGLMCGYTLSLSKSNIDFLIIDSGSKLELRAHTNPIDMVLGTGGAGLYSDGKFSFFPAGEKIWKFDSDQIKLSYQDLKSIMEQNNINIPDIPSEINYKKNNQDNNWSLKKYDVKYLNLDTRKKLINSITDKFSSKILNNTIVLDIIKDKNNDIYKLNLLNSEFNQLMTILTDNIVLCGGRFFPLFTKKLDFIPHEFKRVELGFRVEGDAKLELFNFVTQTDPKFVMADSSNEFRTFCWCRKGETACTKFPINCIFPIPDQQNYISTWSGRSDIIVTNKSNFGFNVRFGNQIESLKYLDYTLETPVFDVELTFNTIDLIPDNYKQIYLILIEGFKNFIKQNNQISHIDIFNSGLRIKGPTIEGVGYYPVSNDQMQVPNENIYIGGDCSGIYRGIIPSMISGSYCAYSCMNNLNTNNKQEKTIIFLSGKRFSGKSTASESIKNHYGSKGKSVLISSFSLSLKKKFCELYNLNLNQFISEHKLKDQYRNQLTEYFYTTDPMEYMKDIHELIENFKEDVLVIDDLRLQTHLNWICTNIKSNNLYDLKIIRINSSDIVRQSRGWVKTDYDQSYVECELDNVVFDFTIQNDLDINNYNKLLSQILN
jgi:phosphomevalonate kinase